MALQVTVVTPEKTLLETQADEVIVPTVTGEIAILPSHVPLFTQLAEGEIIIRSQGKDEHLVGVGGFLEVSKDHVTILADYAVHGKDISTVKAEEAKSRAEKAMKEKRSAQDFAVAEAEFRRAILELKVSKRYRKTS